MSQLMTPPDGTLLLDLSSLQGAVDWAKVAAYRSKDGRRIVGVIARATLGRVRDSRFREYKGGARKAGLLFGAYGVLRPVDDVALQVQAFLDTVGSLEPNDLGCFLDFELEDGRPGNQELDAALRWLVLVEGATGRRPTVYTGKWFMQLLGDPKDSPLGRYPLWVASYTKDPLVPHAWPAPDMWQYSGDKGERVDGILADVDRNVFVSDANHDGVPGTYEDLIAFVEASKVDKTPELPRAESITPDLRDALEPPTTMRSPT